MPTFTPGPRIDDVGRKPPEPPVRGGGGGDGNGDIPDFGARLRRARLGMICAIATVCMVFISLTSAYVFRRGLPTFDGSSNTYIHDWGMVEMPWQLLMVDTVLLLASSVTMEFARRAAAQEAALAPVRSIPGITLDDKKKFPWLGCTLLLGVGFFIGQWMAWSQLHHRGFYVDTNPSSSFVFVLTIGHALHLAGGMIALLWAASASLLHKPAESRRITVDVTAWYWHFMAALWIYIFLLLRFAR
ncbi:MAG TPA: cytochrome c oxidase subunit 3 [Candidatus Sulfotelmatobacter sp.]|jgi:cytochrome c oxidase subunit 3